MYILITILLIKFVLLSIFLRRKGKKWKDVPQWFIGNLRYKVYYAGKYEYLIRPHIMEQIDYRILVMDKECYNNGACKICGCSTTALQMANKACPKPCYPRMVNKEQWTRFKKVNNIP